MITTKTSNEGISAYDYKAQGWVRGSSAVELLRKQTVEVLEILTGPDAEGFAAFTGIRIEEIPGIVERLEDQLADLSL